MPLLIAAGEAALPYLVRRDLLGEATGPVSSLWELPGAAALIRGQRPDGRWRYPGGNRAIRSKDDYDQLETYRSTWAASQVPRRPW